MARTCPTPKELTTDHPKLDAAAVVDLEAAIARAAQRLDASHLYSVVARAIARQAQGGAR